MKPFVLVVRAVGSEFVSRTLKNVGVGFAVGAVVVGVLALWLTTVNEWWWLLALPMVFIVLCGVVLLVVAWRVVALLRPRQTALQREAVAGFVDKLQRVADVVGVPYWFILLRVTRDILWPRENAYVVQMTKDSATLHKDLWALQKLFASKE